VATGIALLVGDRTGALELGRSAIRGLQWGGDRRRMGIVVHRIAGALATTRPDAAAIIEGAAQTNVVQAPIFASRINSAVTEALGEERARELRARGADMDWDQALAYTLTQTTPSPQLARIGKPAMNELVRPAIGLYARQQADKVHLGRPRIIDLASRCVQNQVTHRD
jgi:hypothetical protein